MMNHSDNTPRLDQLPEEALVDEVDEQLVAYLDGELPPEQRTELERSLGHDPQLRRRLRQLQGGWEMLDELPMATPSPQLVESTIRMAAVSSRSLTAQAGRPVGRRWPRLSSLTSLLGGLVVIACLVGGAGAAHLYERWQLRTQLRKLPLAMHVDAYIHGADLEMIRQLMQMEQWQQTIAIAQRLGEWDFSIHQAVDTATASQREAMLQQLPVEEQQVVFDHWRRYQALDGARRRQVATVAARVDEQPDAEQLRMTMDHYARWRESLSPQRRDEIREADLPQRMELIRHWLQETTQQRLRSLGDEDARAIFDQLRTLAQRRLAAMANDPQAARSADRPDPEQLLREFRSLGPFFEPVALRTIFVLNQDPRFRRPSGTAFEESSSTEISERAERSGGSPPRPPGFSFGSPRIRRVQQRFESIAGPLTDDELLMIEAVLEEPILREVLEIVATWPELHDQTLRIWAEEALWYSPFRSDHTAYERYLDLDPDVRDQIDLLQADEILHRLRGRFGRRGP